VVIDVGTNFEADGSMVGDVDAEAVDGLVRGLTPVPGGVGPVTTAVLLRNTLAAVPGG
jgi:methylenetetrahydrofolate dehydrogenase (NADP+)/methenyltetrahydrofolate cyclohydrolase